MQFMRPEDTAKRSLRRVPSMKTLDSISGVGTVFQCFRSVRASIREPRLLQGRGVLDPARPGDWFPYLYQFIELCRSRRISPGQGGDSDAERRARDLRWISWIVSRAALFPNGVVRLRDPVHQLNRRPHEDRYQSSHHLSNHGLYIYLIWRTQSESYLSVIP
jgi:hypothetical protein